MDLKMGPKKIQRWIWTGHPIACSGRSNGKIENGSLFEWQVHFFVCLFFCYKWLLSWLQIITNPQSKNQEKQYNISLPEMGGFFCFCFCFCNWIKIKSWNNPETTFFVFGNKRTLHPELQCRNGSMQSRLLSATSMAREQDDDN
jgi:hypothetical protein